MPERHRGVEDPRIPNPSNQVHLIQESQPSWSLGHKEITCILYVHTYDEDLGVTHDYLPSVSIDQSTESILGLSSQCPMRWCFSTGEKMEWFSKEMRIEA